MSAVYTSLVIKLVTSHAGWLISVLHACENSHYYAREWMIQSQETLIFGPT